MKYFLAFKSNFYLDSSFNSQAPSLLLWLKSMSTEIKNESVASISLLEGGASPIKGGKCISKDAHSIQKYIHLEINNLPYLLTKPNIKL